MNISSSQHGQNGVATHFRIQQDVSRTTMSSREVADLVGSRHDSVKRTIERLQENGVVSFTPSVETSHEGAGARPVEVYLVNKRDSFVVVAQLSPEFTARLVDRWQELEERMVSPVTLPSYAEALRLYADQIEQTAVLRVENHQQAEKIASLESIFQVGMTPTQFCKRLNGVNCQQVNNALLARRWIFNSERDEKRSVKYRVGSLARDKYLTEKVTTISNEGVDPFPKYTPILLKEGAKRLHELYMAQKLPMKRTWDGQFCHCKATEEDLG
ncbi:Rha family transcriptional regulator [Pseudomonas sp.]|uniref:Rha family transcriptional regulator n=1 Tax=Pseudomonas sp. TaxID=306 RepID=UPI003F2D3305